MIRHFRIADVASRLPTSPIATPPLPPPMPCRCRRHDDRAFAAAPDASQRYAAAAPDTPQLPPGRHARCSPGRHRSRVMAHYARRDAPAEARAFAASPPEPPEHARCRQTLPERRRRRRCPPELSSNFAAIRDAMPRRCRQMRIRRFADVVCPPEDDLMRCFRFARRAAVLLLPIFSRAASDATPVSSPRRRCRAFSRRCLPFFCFLRYRLIGFPPSHCFVRHFRLPRRRYVDALLLLPRAKSLLAPRPAQRAASAAPIVPRRYAYATNARRRCCRRAWRQYAVCANAARHAITRNVAPRAPRRHGCRFDAAVFVYARFLRPLMRRHATLIVSDYAE